MAEGSRWKEEVYKLVAVAVATLATLWFILTYPSIPAVIICVLAIAVVAYYFDSAFRPKNAIYPRGKAVFITGCDTGIGHALALTLDEQGVQVFAGCRHARTEGALVLRNKASPRLHVLPCDVTSMDDVTTSMEYVTKNLGQNELWGVVNNAGLNSDGDIELLTMQLFEQVNNVNYLGMVRVTKAFIPLIRQSRGRFVNITSVKGRIPTPFCAAYTATKYAGEAFSDILRMEMRKFGVSVSVIEPGHFGGATAMVHMPRLRDEYAQMWAALPEEGKHVYGEEYIEAHLRLMESESAKSCFDLTRITNAIEDALFDFNPQTRYLIAGGNGLLDYFKLKTMLKPYLPDRLMDSLLLRGTSSLPRPKTS